MKKTVLVFFLLLIAVSVFAQTGQGSGVIRMLSGTVELKHPGAADFVIAEVGAEVRQNTVISTGFRSNALIEVGTSTIIAVQPLTRLTLTEIRAAAGTETLNANLQAGRVRVDVNPPAGTRASMSVSSPSATASVRGTTLFFDGRNLGVSGGMATFQGDRGPPVLLGDGFFSRIGMEGKPGNPIFAYSGNELGGGTGILFSGPPGSDPSSGAATLGVDSGPGFIEPDGNTPQLPPGGGPGGGGGGSGGGGNSITININYGS